ncbi:hypothetical protein GCM10023331_00990 [Algivirga pacifica]|uniref:Fibronectin type-III domain-containing protein n=1 Tax=Algivirga pacifica TaxID=1162670 RepID=A0ABP9D255_9BACT
MKGKVDVFLNGSGADSIVLFSEETVRLNIAADEGKYLLGYEIFLGGNLFLPKKEISVESKVTNLNIEALIKESNLQEGDNELKVIVYATSGSGSLLNALGGEQVYWEQLFNVIWDTSSPKPLQIAVDTTDGFVNLSWSVAEHPNFSHYQVYAQLKKGCRYGTDLPEQVLKRIDDRESTTFRDETFICGEVVYRVEAHTKNNRSNDGTVSFKASFEPNIKMTYLYENTVEITWDASELTGPEQTVNFEPFDYRTQERVLIHQVPFGYSSLGLQMTFSSPPTDEYYTYKHPGIYRPRLEIKEKLGRYSEEQHYYSKSLGAHIVKLGGKWKVLDKNDLTRDVTFDASLLGDYTKISPSGMHGISVDFSDSTMLLKVFAFKEQEIKRNYNIYTLFSGFSLKDHYSFLYAMRVDDQGNIIGKWNEKLYCIPFETSEAAFFIDNVTDNLVKISPDGKYVLTRYSLYKKETNRFSKVSNFTWDGGHRSDAFFNFNNTEELFVIEDLESMKIWDLSTTSIKSEAPFYGFLKSKGVDPETNSVVLVTGNYEKKYTTGTVVYDIDTRTSLKVFEHIDLNEMEFGNYHQDYQPFYNYTIFDPSHEGVYMYFSTLEK